MSITKNSSHIVLATTSAIVAIAVALFTTPYMGVASFAYFIMVTGYIYKKQKRTHVFLMNAAITIDILLVLILQFQRSAIQTAVKMELGYIQQTHIASSLAATLLYLPILYFGWMRYKRPETTSHLKQKHLFLGKIAFVLRTIGFITMFTLIKHVTS